MLGLWATITMDGTLEVSGTFGEARRLAFEVCTKAQESAQAPKKIINMSGARSCQECMLP